MTDEQIVKALNACTFGQTKETRCKDCPLDSEKEPCITNLHLAALEYIGRLKKRAEVAEKAFKKYLEKEACRFCNYKKINYCEATKEIQEDCFNATIETYIEQAEKELAEERKDEN